MLQNIPTHLIAGPLGAGKTSVLRCLLEQRPADERWAVLINEFGQIGLDAALLQGEDQQVRIAEVAGGCVCCVTGVPFQVGLGRLLRRVRPHRLFIEPSGLGHPLQLLEQLQRAPWQGVLAVQPLVMVLDGQALARGDALPDIQQQALVQAGLVIINKAEAVDESQRLLINAEMLDLGRLWTTEGKVSFHSLPVTQLSAESMHLAVEPLVGNPPVPTLWITHQTPICQIHQGTRSWSIGWCWHPGQRFDLERITDWLRTLGWQRAKGVLHGPSGWQACNALDQAPLTWTASAWRRDSRLELIFAEAQDVSALNQALEECRLNPAE